jgi:hypothetical protein
MMDNHARFALAHPIYDPPRDVRPGHYWQAEREVSAGLTCNIGEE